MPLFEYLAITSEKGEVKGLVEAATSESATSALLDRGLKVLSLREKRRQFFSKAKIPFLNAVGAKDLVLFSRQFSVLVSSTLPVVAALRILARQTKSDTFRGVILEVADAVDGGARLSDALASHPKIFSSFFIAMIRSGETAGKLDEVLNYLADEQEKDYDLMSKTRGAMIYPAFILFGLLVVGAVMMIFVLPKLTAILQEAQVDLPITTRMLIASSNFASNFWWLFIILFIGLVAAAHYWRQTEAGRLQTDYLILKLPMFGPLIFQKLYLVRFTRSLYTLLSGGVSINDGLKITSGVVGNQVFKDLIRQAIHEVEDGKPLAGVFLQSAVVPSMVGHMLSVGEQTGRVDLVLSKLSSFYAREVDNAVANLVTLIEPLILMVMGVAVGVMVAAILLPLYNLASGVA